MSQTQSQSQQVVPLLQDGRAEFFLIVAPGLEDLALKELQEWLPNLTATDDSREGDITLERGGLRVRAKLSQGLELNRCLKTPTRILLRLAEFGCRDFPKLFKKISGFSWGDWLPDDRVIEFNVSTHGSRLKMKKRIEETCLDGRKAYLKKKGLKPAAQGEPIHVFVRILDDICMVSLDTSGELLHKRGLRTLSSEAPLRETIAASLLLLLDFTAPRLAPETRVELVDPMTGGGTFLLEASGLRQPVRTRRYSFEENQPLLKQAGEIEPLKNRAASRFSAFVGFDLDAKALQAAKGNLAQVGASEKLGLHNVDFLKAEPLGAPLENTVRWLVVNPPYGERIKVEGGLSDFYSRLMIAAEKVAQPERACFLLPAKVRPNQIRAPREWRLVEERKFANGGLPVVAAVYVRR